MRLLISYLKEKLPVVGVYAVMLVIFCILVSAEQTENT